MSNIKDVARLADVAPSTVSNVFTQKKHVSREVCERVRAACDALNYSPSLIASGMRTKKTRHMGLFLTSSEGGFADFYYPLIEGVTISAAEQGYSVILYYGIDDEAKMHSFLESGRGPIDCAIILTPRTSDFRFKELNEGNVPYALIGKMSGCDVPYVDVENDFITYKIVRQLLEQGRKNPVFLNSERELCVTEDRLNGFRRALADYKIPFRPERCANIRTDENEAYEVLSKLLIRETDCVIVESDISAKGVYRALKDSGRRAGDDVKVAALGGARVAATLDPPVTTVVTDYRKIGRLAASVAIGECKGENSKTGNFVEAEIIYR